MSNSKNTRYFVLDTGHFALEEDGDTIAKLIQDFHRLRYGSHRRDQSQGDRARPDAPADGAVIAAGGVMRYLIKDPTELARVLQGISEGYQLGLNAKLLLSQKWEHGWERPVSEWRQELGVQPHQGGGLRPACGGQLAGAPS